MTCGPMSVVSKGWLRLINVGFLQLKLWLKVSTKTDKDYLPSSHRVTAGVLALAILTTKSVFLSVNRVS